MMRGKARKARPHAFYRRSEIACIEISHGDGQMIAMMEFVLGEETTLKTINQGKDLGISHFSTSKEKRPQATAYGRNVYSQIQIT